VAVEGEFFGHPTVTGTPPRPVWEEYMAAYAANRAPTSTKLPTVPVGDPILTSKITPPDVPAWAVQRPRITRLIAEGTRWCPLTVVTGPAGAGKTMAAALWAAAESSPVAWICLDEFDNRPGAFWSYVVAALRRAGVAPRGATQVIPPESADHDGFLLGLTALMAGQVPPVTLVLDDLHVLTDPGALKGLDFLLRNVGSGLRLVVTSRMDPLLPLHRYRLAGQLTEIRADDLKFSAVEAGELLAQHGSTLTADSLENLTQRTEGWAAGLRLAAISLGAHPDPGQFVKELMAEDSALICYLVDEVLNAQPPEVREVLLSTSILEHVSADAAIDLTGNERAAGILASLVRTNAFVQPLGSGWYRYHTLLSEVLRLKLRFEHPRRVTVLNQRAARWYERHGRLADAVRHAVRAGEWPLAATMVVDGLAIGELIDERAGNPLAGEFTAMPADVAWTEPAPYLTEAALALAAGQHGPCSAALDAADRLLERLPAEHEVPGRLAAALIRLTVSLRLGDLARAQCAADSARTMLSLAAGEKLDRHPEIRRIVLSGRAAVALWSGHQEEAARLLEAGLAAGQVPGQEHGWAGQLALVEALRGRLSRAAELAGHAAAPNSEHRLAGQCEPDATSLAALALVHLERNELREARRFLKQAGTALGAKPDKLLSAVAHLIAARAALVEGRATAATDIVARARSSGPVPAWLDQQFGNVESRAWAAAGDVSAALATAERVGSSPEAAITLAHAWAAAGNGGDARDALAPALAPDSRLPDPARVQALLLDARLSYESGDAARGRRTLGSALRLAEREQLGLPLALERFWLGPTLRRDPELVDSHRRLLTLGLGREFLPAPVMSRAAALVVEPLTERELEVLVHVSDMLNTAEVAREMYISVNTVKTHLRNIYRKLAASHRNEAVRRARQLELI
jgi:LuxR family transcriptional regulator, maltose regulon positive regulatory protein